MTLSLRWMRRAGLGSALTAVFALSAPLPATAQSLTAGSLRATVLDPQGAPIRETLVTLERLGVAFRTAEANRAGGVSLEALPPGQYTLLVEQLGYQPVRLRGFSIFAGNASEVTVRLVRRPPPIASVDEQVAQVTFRGAAPGRVFAGDQLTRLDRERSIVDLRRDLSQLPTRLFVDGLEETLLRHPGRRSELASAPIFTRDGISSVTMAMLGRDGEWRGAPGPFLSAQTMRGGRRLQVTPWATFSGASLGGRAVDNPADSAGSSLQAGVALGGPIKGDTSSWFLRVDYQQLRTPSAAPFENADATSAFTSVAGTRAGEIARWLSPTVRSWQGLTGQGRVDWQFGSNTALMVRAGMASWSEDNPTAGIEMTNGAGDRLDASDLSLAASLTTQRDGWLSETRLGMRSSSREWTGTGAALSTLLASGSSVGTPFAGGGVFDESAFEVVQSVSYRTGRHTLKAGLSAQRRTVTYSWIPGASGRYAFGTVDAIGGGTGTYQQMVGGSPAPDIASTEAGIFLQDAYQLSPALELFGGLRLETQRLPTDLYQANVAWGLASGFTTATHLKELSGDRFAPRVGFTYNAAGEGRTVLRGTIGRLAGRYDLAAVSEVAQFNGDIAVHRAEGTLAFPTPGTLSGATVVGPSLTFFGPEVRKPRAFEGELSWQQQLASGTTLTITGGYRHADFLLRRDDLNRPVAPLATAVDGREIWGTLVQYGELIAPAIGSNRRFSGFDAAYGLTSTGYSDSYDATVRLERPIGAGATFAASYTFSRTEDNLVGQLSGDPADRLSPLSAASTWDVGRSDLDIPHRLAASVTLRPGVDGPLSLAARARYRSGLPFTPGYRQGVDINGDGSGGNDPVALTGAPAGLAAVLANAHCSTGGSGVAERNSCREDAVASLDLSLALRLGAGGRRIALTLDAFNVVGSATGVVDRAALLVDPTGTITTSAAGRTVVPMVVNDNFGTLLSRRGEPRTLRIGLRVEN